MTKDFFYHEEAIDKFYTYIDRAIIIKVGYLLMIFILKGLNVYSSPDIIFAVLAVMALTSLAIGISFEEFNVKPGVIINILFLSTILDLFLLTVVIYYLGGIEFIYYTFYIILSFIVFPRKQAIFLTAWTIILFVGLVLLRYFGKIPVYYSTLPKEEQTFDGFANVATMVPTYVVTFVFLAYFSYGFYKMMEKRIYLLRAAQKILEEEKSTLEIRVSARKREIEAEKRSLKSKVQERNEDLEKERKELEEKLGELEMFQKLALGREIKMQDLEKEAESVKVKIKKRRP